jgi:ESS family glutamate:Na+ symporter
MNANIIGFSILLIATFLIIGKVIRVKFSIFSKFYLPSSLIAGTLLLLIGPEVLGQIFTNIEPLSHMQYGLLTGSIMDVISSLPGLLITVIFASLFLGKNIPSIKKIWHMAGPQISYGQIISWGQYVLGLLVAMLILVPVFNANPMVGGLVEIAFEGGHGTVAGLADTFAELGFNEGADLALGLATVGIVSSMFLGIIVINWGVRTNKTSFLKHKPKEFDELKSGGIILSEDRKKESYITTNPQSIEPLAFHLGIIALAIIVGLVLLESLRLLENFTWGAYSDVVIVGYLPLFPFAMIGGVIVQLFIKKFDKYKLVSRNMISRIQGLSLDFLITSAIAMLSLQVIGNNLGVFIILAITGIGWNVFGFIVLSKYIIPKNWFERSIGDFGQSMGMTAAGLMLMTITDPENKTKAIDAFGYKQLLFEPIFGGGLMTALSVPLIMQFGPFPLFVFCFVLMSFWIIFGIRLRKKLLKKDL